MKKTLPLLLFALLFFTQLSSQIFSGINTGNYGGITGVMLQPASIVDSRFKFDINLFSTDARFSNNYFLLDRDVLLKLNKNNFDNYPTFRSKYLSEAALAPGEKAFFNISNRTQLPLSFMVTLNEKSALAFNLQSRSMIQGRNIDPELAKLAFNSFYHPPLNNQPIDASGITIRSLSWVEAGLTYGHVLFNSGNHFLKGAFTVKYLGGVSSLNLSANNLTLQVNSDSSFNFTADRVNYDHNKNVDLDRVIDSRFRPDANAFGMDAGLVYEFRGNLGNIKYIRNDDEKSYEVKRRDLNKYIFKLGVSVLDAGMFQFTKDNNVNSFAANINNWDIRNANYSSISEFDTALANRVSPLPNDPRNYNMYLPGALSVQMDIRFVKGLYLNAMAYRPLKMGNKAGTRFNNYGYYSITPRYERRHFGIYVPYTFSDKEDITSYRDNWLGLTLRLGPIFLGSSNLGTMAFNKELKAADFFVGLKIGFTYGKPSKITRLLTRKNEPSYDSLLIEKQKKEEMTSRSVNNTTLNADTSAANRLIVDYTKGQIYSDGKTGQVIVVNTYNYYGNPPVNAPNPVTANNNAASALTLRDSIKVDSIVSINMAQRRQTDSLNKNIKDSLMQKREQLDSLINQLYNLRQRLDSTNKIDSSAGYNSQRSSNEAIRPDSTVSADSTSSPDLQLSDSVQKNPTPDSLNIEATAKTDTLKKKETALPAETNQLNTVDSIRTLPPSRETVTPVFTNDAMQQRQQTISDKDYDAYLKRSEELQNDIERLERQIIYNRSAASNFRPQPNYNTPVYNNPIPVYINSQPLYNNPQPYYNNPVPGPTTIYPPTTPEFRPTEKDTIVFRDSVFVTRTDTIIKTMQSTPTTVIVPVPNQAPAAEKMDYRKLPPENILFATGKVFIVQVYIEKLTYLANILLQNPELTITVTGHTDKTGSKAINERLSLQRAEAVKSFFVNKGISENRIHVVAVASEDPLVPGETSNAKMQNRRVEIKLQ